MNWKEAIGGIAPALAGTLGTIIGTPAIGTLAYGAINKLCSACGMEPTPENAQSIAQLASDGKLTGDQIVALKLADIAHIEAVQKEADQVEQLKAQNAVQAMQIAANDRDSARKMATNTKDWMPKVLAALIVAGFLVSIFMVLTGHATVLKDPTCAALTASLFTYLSTKSDKVYNYYFGGLEDAAKTEMLFNSQPIQK